MNNDSSYNPYAPPANVSSDPSSTGERNNRWLTSMCVLQLLVIAVAIGLEAWEHETIVGSGLVFAIVGMIIAGISCRRDRILEFFAGISAPLLAAFIVFMIKINGWSPATGDKPITIFISVYSVVFVPILIGAIVRQRMTIRI